MTFTSQVNDMPAFPPFGTQQYRIHAGSIVTGKWNPIRDVHGLGLELMSYSLPEGVEIWTQH